MTVFLSHNKRVLKRGLFYYFYLGCPIGGMPPIIPDG